MGEAGRDRWSGRTAFIMAAVGSAVGLGNVWRFPAVAYANGGGAFFIPYFVALLTAGIPLMILEFGLGQMMQGGAPQALKKANKNFEWLGWFALLVGALISIYYAVIMAYAWQYLGYSFSVDMPWSRGGGPNPENGFFTDHVLGFSTAAGERGSIRPWLLVGLALTWGAVFLIIHKGVLRVGKVVMITVPLPAAILLILALRGITLEGSAAGLEYYLKPDFAALAKASTWQAAYGQVFFSLSLGFGILIAYASYMPRDSDVSNNAFITSFANCATSFLAGFAVFSTLGYLAWASGTEVKDVVASGPGLAFVTYPAAISKMAALGGFWPPVIGVLFFVMLLTLGIDSLFSLIEAVVTGLRDRFPWIERWMVAAALCGLGFVVGGAVFASRAGLAWLDLFDHWTCNYGLVLVGLLECVLVGYFFPTRKLRAFVNRVSDIRLGHWWELCIRVVTPIILVYILFSNVLDEFVKPYGAGYPSFMGVTAKVIFLGLVVAAFAIARKWVVLGLAGATLILGLVFYGLMRPFSVSIEHELKEGRDLHLRAQPASEDVLYRWELGDGKSAEGREVSHVYFRPREYEVELWARNRSGKGETARAKKKILVMPLQALRPGIALDTTMTTADPCRLAFKGKAAGGTPPYAFEWTLKEGVTLTGERPRLRFDGSGRYDCAVRVKDSVGDEHSTAFPVDVEPFAIAVRALPPGGACPVRVSFEARAFGPGGVELGEADLWDAEKKAWVEGGSATEKLTFDWKIAGEHKEGPKLEHTFYSPGKHACSLVVSAPGAGRMREQLQIEVRPPTKRSPGIAACLGAIGGAILLGGLGVCIAIALRAGRGKERGA